jgi:hypothetical protein
MPPVGFEPAIPASERTQIDALERVTTGFGTYGIQNLLNQLPVTAVILTTLLFTSVFSIWRLCAITLQQDVLWSLSESEGEQPVADNTWLRARSLFYALYSFSE